MNLYNNQIISLINSKLYSLNDIAKLLSLSSRTVQAIAKDSLSTTEYEAVKQNSKLLRNIKIAKSQDKVDRLIRNGIEYIEKCAHCSKIIKVDTKFCSVQCQQNYGFDDRYTKWLQGADCLVSEPRALRRLVTQRDGYKCSRCELSSWQGEEIVLELEHKNGNSDDNAATNLCLLCPNCHSLTSTFKNKNKGNGRFKRRQRYAKGKSS